MATRPARAAIGVGAGAALSCLAMLAIWWPGVAEYDSVQQYRQVLAGRYEDWHPPAMARLWALLHPLAPGTAPLFVAQLLACWIGLGLIAAALARSGRVGAAVVILVIGVLPLVAGWEAAVLKDVQMLGALLAVLGLVCWWRLAGRRVPLGIVVLIGMLLVYATLVRANAVFATVPLAVLLAHRPTRPGQRGLAIAAATLAVLALTPVINHRVMGAAPTDVARTLPIYDLAGITHVARADIGLLPSERALIDRRHCYQPYFWDPLGDDGHCGAVAQRLDAMPMRSLVAAWVAAIAYHPIAYARHRMAHWNSTERWLVAAGRPDATPPDRSEPNDLGLASPGRFAAALARIGGWLAETPLGWPVAWLIVAASAAWIAAHRPPEPARDIALALAVSALALEASFGVVSIASDLRYHLWPMIAAAIAAVLLAGDRPLPRRPLILGGAALILVIATGMAARLAMPRGPGTYQGMLG